MSQFTFFPAPSGTGYAQLYDDDSPTPNPIGSPVAIPASTTVPVTAPHGTVMTSDMDVSVMDVLSGETKPLPKSKILFNDASDALAFTDLYDNKFDGNLYPGITIPRRELKDSASAGIGIYASLDGLIDDTIDDIPDNTITLPDGTTTTIKATAPYDTRPLCPMKFTFGKYRSLSVVWTITSDEAGNYTAWTDDGSSGTITFSKNGGAFAAMSGTIALAVGDTIQAKRTTSTAQGWSRWAH